MRNPAGRFLTLGGLILFAATLACASAGSDQIIILNDGLEVLVVGDVEWRERLVLFRTPDGLLRSLQVEQVRDVIPTTPEPADQETVAEASQAKIWTNADLAVAAVPTNSETPVQSVHPVVTVVDPGELSTPEQHFGTRRKPRLKSGPDDSKQKELERARREVYRLNRLYQDPEGAGRVNRINRNNKVNRVRRRSSETLEDYYRLELIRARERLERLEKAE